MRLVGFSCYLEVRNNFAFVRGKWCGCGLFLKLRQITPVHPQTPSKERVTCLSLLPSLALVMAGLQNDFKASGLKCGSVVRVQKAEMPSQVYTDHFPLVNPCTLESFLLAGQELGIRKDK